MKPHTMIQQWKHSGEWFWRERRRSVVLVLFISTEKQGEFLGAFGEPVNVRECQEGGRARPVSEGGREGGKEGEGGRERGRRGGKGGRVVG